MMETCCLTGHSVCQCVFTAMVHKLHEGCLCVAHRQTRPAAPHVPVENTHQDRQGNTGFDRWLERCECAARVDHMVWKLSLEAKWSCLRMYCTQGLWSTSFTGYL